MTDHQRQLVHLARTVRGFMPDDEGDALRAAAVRAIEAWRAAEGLAAGAEGGRPAPGEPAERATLRGPARRATLPGAERPVVVEIGAWCGKSTVYLGAAAEATGALVFSVDHHRGSEENQAGWEHHDPDLVDVRDGRIDTLPHWRRTVAEAGLEEVVVGVVGDSPTVAAAWRTPLALCFLDGGHGEGPAWADYRGWAPHVAQGGLLAIHDVFPDPADGGRPPYELWCDAIASGEWEEEGACGSLRVLRRLPPEGERAGGAGR